MISETEYVVSPELIHLAQQELKSFEGKAALNRPTGNFFYDPWIIKEKFRNTVWEDILNTLDFSYGEARVIVLNPGESYMAHADIDDRFHLNLQGNHSFLIDISDQKMYPTIADNKWYSMDAGKIHAATNYGEIFRAQLVVRKLLERGKLNSYVRITIVPTKNRADYRYQFDNIISPWLNRLNSRKKIDNFYFNEQQVDFDLSSDLLNELDNFDKEIFSIIKNSND